MASLKNDKERLLTPPPMLMTMLKEQKREQVERRMKAGPAWHGWNSVEEQKTWFVFTTEFGDHYCPQTVYAHFKKIARQIGAEKANVHSLRHTYAVLCLQNGDDVKTVQSNLGHATAAFTLDGNVKKCAVGKHPKSEKHGNTAQFSEVERSGTQENCGGIGSGCRLRLRPLPVLRRRQSQRVARIDPNAVVVDKNIAENDRFDLFSR